MSEWELHVPNESNRITVYKCGLIAGERVRLKKNLVQMTHNEEPTGVVNWTGEEWTVLAGITTDPVLWFRQANGEVCTWDDDAASVDEWFEKI